ncbi:MAG TPA: energy transducer TonB [Puia sp.]|jgi:protein TonB|nr:energy transducer TonB [Puia sp.]
MKIILSLAFAFCFCSTHAQTDSAVYFNPEIQAEYPGGPAAWYRYLAKNLTYPDIEVKEEMDLKVTVRFAVDSLGHSSHFTAVRGSEGLRNEAIRVIRNIKIWVPAVENGKKVNSWKEVTIGFELANQ